MTYTLWDLFSLIGNALQVLGTISVANILMVALWLIAWYISVITGLYVTSKGNKFYKERKEDRELKDAIKTDRPFSTIAEEIDNISKLELDKRHNKGMQAEAKQKLDEENEEAIETFFETKPLDIKIGKEISNTDIKEIFEPKTDSIGRPIGKPRGKKKSIDREDYPQVFEAMYKLHANLVKMVGVNELARRLNVTPTSITAISRKEITTLKTAKKYITKFNKVLNDMLEPTTPEEIVREKGLAKAHQDQLWEISGEEKTEYEKQTKELLRVVDYLLSQMTQSDLSARVDVPQSYISDISTRKPVRGWMMKEYIRKFQRVEAIILWASLTNNRL